MSETSAASPKSALDTPALLIDLDVLEANIDHIAQTCRNHGVAWRPHFKGHKTLEIARKQLAAGGPAYTDTTVHPHEEIVAPHNGQVVWKVAGRGKIR